MKRLLRLIVIIITHFSLLMIHSSCTQDAYEKGEGKYSLMRADFVEARANAEKQIDQIITDDGEQLLASKPFTAKLVVTPDSVYRCILYYNKVRDERGYDVFEPISIGLVPCPNITPISALKKEMKTDPVKFESAWLSKTGKYLNLSLYLMTGASDNDEAIHTIHVIQDTIMTHPDATRTCYLRLYHDQAGVPEYYSSQVYASILTSQIEADSVHLTVNTYKGLVTKTFSLR